MPAKSLKTLTAALITIIVLALLFDFHNGFHNAANAICQRNLYARSDPLAGDGRGLPNLEWHY